MDAKEVGGNEFGELTCDTWVYDDPISYEWCSPGHITQWHIGVSHFLTFNRLKLFFEHRTEWEQNHTFKRAKLNCTEGWMPFCKKCLLLLLCLGEKERERCRREHFIRVKYYYFSVACVCACVCMCVCFICMCTEEAEMENKRGWQCGLAPAVNLPQSQMAGPWSLGCDGLALIAGGNPCLWV